MKFLKRLKSGNFWISMISAVVLILQAVFNIEIKAEYLNQIILGILGLLVMFGIVSDGSSEETSSDKTNTESLQNIINLISQATTSLESNILNIIKQLTASEQNTTEAVNTKQNVEVAQNSQQPTSQTATEQTGNDVANVVENVQNTAVQSENVQPVVNIEQNNI